MNQFGSPDPPQTRPRGAQGGWCGLVLRVRAKLVEQLVHVSRHLSTGQRRRTAGPGWIVQTGGHPYGLAVGLI